MCGEVYTYQIGGWDNDTIGNEMFLATHGDVPAFSNAKIHEMAIVSYHLCKDESLGVCDFIGVRKVKSEF